MNPTTLLHHPTLAHALKYTSLTVGRDKLLRTIQYFARFYAWYLYRTNALPSQIAPWATIKSQLSLARKALRFGKFLEHFKAAAVAAAVKTQASNLSSEKVVKTGIYGALGQEAVKWLAVGRQLGYAGYLSLDAVTYPHAAGIYKSEKMKKLSKTAQKFWAMGLICSVLSGTIQKARLRAAAKSVDRKEGEGVVEAKRLEKYVARDSPLLFADVGDGSVGRGKIGLAKLLRLEVKC